MADNNCLQKTIFIQLLDSNHPGFKANSDFETEKIIITPRTTVSEIMKQIYLPDSYLLFQKKSKFCLISDEGLFEIVTDGETLFLFFPPCVG